MPSAPDTVYRAVKRLYNIGVYPEWWKLEHLEPSQWREIDALVRERDPYCRGVVLLGLHASIEELAASFEAASGSTTCRGFMVGRTIFHVPSQRWRAGDGHALLFAAGELRGQAVDLLPQPDGVEQRARAACHFVVRKPPEFAHR